MRGKSVDSGRDSSLRKAFVMNQMTKHEKKSPQGETTHLASPLVPQLLGREVASTRRKTARQNGPLLARLLLRIRYGFPQQPQCDLISASLGRLWGSLSCSRHDPIPTSSALQRLCARYSVLSLSYKSLFKQHLCRKILH